MRQTYVAPVEPMPSGGERRRRTESAPVGHTVGAVFMVVLLDTAAIAFSTVLLWLGAGTTVLSGAPVAMTMAFAGGAVLAALSNLSAARAGTGGAMAIGLTSTVLLVAAYALRIFVVQAYFFSWVIVYAGAFVAARGAVALVIDGFAGRASRSLLWRLVAVGTGIAAVVSLGEVWSDSALLADLVVFVFLLSIAAVLFELGVRSFRRFRQSED